MAKKVTKKDLVIKTIKTIAEQRTDGKYILPKEFVRLLSSDRNRRYTGKDRTLKNGPWYCTYENLKLFSCWTRDMIDEKGLAEHRRRFVDGLEFTSDEKIRGLDGYPADDKVLLLTNQLGGGEGGGNLAAFCKLVEKYETNAELPQPMLTQEDKDFLCSGAERSSRGNDKSPLIGDKSRNLIVFGAPGTGKSRYLKELLNKKYGELEDASERTEESYFADFDRVTFYPSYSYAQFVGSYKPYMAEVDKDGFEPQQGDARRRKVIAYKFEPGPFLRILVKAIKDPSRNYLLVIEEINRANAAAVFGDMFQLLDRCDGGQDGEKGCSEYDITPSEDVQKYLSENQVAETSKLRIPANLYIWATMNSADQGVFPLDTAFKRRWDFKYLSLDDKNGNDNVDVECGPGGLCKWGKLRKAINSLLARNRVNEDKHLSAYFVKPDGEDRISGERFKMKVLMYLWEDAARMCRTQIFNKNIKTFSELMRAWDSVKLSNVDAEGRTLGGDNPLESIFSFGTEKIERVVVTKGESSKDIDDTADEAGDEPITSEEQDDATDQTSADVKTAEEAPSEDPQVVDDSKNTDAETPSPAEDEQKTPEGQGGATDKMSAEVKTAEEAPSEDSQAVDDPKNADAVAPNQEGNVQEKGDGQVQ